MSLVNGVNNIYNQISSTNTGSASPEKLLNLLKKEGSKFSKNKFIREMKLLTSEQVMNVLDNYFNFLVENVEKIDSSKTLQRLAETIPLQALEDAIRTECFDQLDILKTAKILLKDKAQFLIDVNEHKFSSTLKSKLRSILNALIACIESIVTAFGVAEFFKLPENDMQANTKGQRFFTLLSLFGVLSAALLPLLGPAIAAPLVAGILLFLAGLSLIYPYIKPMPHRIPKAVNWTLKLEQGSRAAIVNENTLKRIERAIVRGQNLKVKTHPMIIGKSGIGKSEAAFAFTDAIYRGKYPKLKGKTVFYINSADLLSGNNRMEGNKELQRISEALGRHRKNVILIFDEIHILCQKKNNVLAEQLKTMLDGEDGFPHVIGITTQEEFCRDILSYNTAFARRFEKINIENPQDNADAQIHQILNRTLMQKAPTALMDKNCIAELHKQTITEFSDAAQPATSIKILSQCINLISDTQKSDLEDQIDNKRREIDLLYSKVFFENGCLPKDKTELEQIARLETVLKGLEEEFNKHEKEMEKLQQQRQIFDNIKMEIFKNVPKITKLPEKLRRKDKKLLNQFLLSNYLFIPAMEKAIRKNAQKLKIKAVINQDLITEVIKIEKENQEKVRKAVQKGQEDLNKKENIQEITAAT